MNRRHITLGLVITMLLATHALADIAQDWNNIALDLQARGNSPANAPLFGNAVNSNPGTRASAIQWLAVNDATVPLTGANNPYYAHLPAPSLPGGFQDLAVQAAVAQASHDAIVGTLGEPWVQCVAASGVDDAARHELDEQPQRPGGIAERRAIGGDHRGQIARFAGGERRSWRCERPTAGTHRNRTRFPPVRSRATGFCRRTRR